MKSRSVIIVVVILVVIVVALIAVSAILLFYPRDHKKQLEGALRDADRIELQTTAMTADYPGMMLAEIRGRKEVERFLGMVELKGRPDGGGCDCDGDCIIAIYDGDRRLCRVHYFYPARLRWVEGKWSGDADLTKESGSRIFEWLINNGLEGSDDYEPAWYREKQ